jgi:hypothetical protein
VSGALREILRGPKTPSVRLDVVLTNIPNRWGILTAHCARFGMKSVVYEQIQARKVKARLRMLQHAQPVSGNVSHIQCLRYIKTKAKEIVVLVSAIFPQVPGSC